uniref:Uncharacterized protein n=1 Tax=Anguilla anguilla TaxID=7936 RepID=A0A0E9P7Y0_ANGAN
MGGRTILTLTPKTTPFGNQSTGKRCIRI